MRNWKTIGVTAGAFGMMLVAILALSAQSADVNAAAGDRDQIEAIINGHQQPVVMFSTNWCPECRRARRYFRQRRIAFAEYDIEKSAAGKRVFEHLGGTAVPLILARSPDGHEVGSIYGLNKGWLRRMLGR